MAWLFLRLQNPQKKLMVNSPTRQLVNSQIRNCQWRARTAIQVSDITQIAQNLVAIEIYSHLIFKFRLLIFLTNLQI